MNFCEGNGDMHEMVYNFANLKVLCAGEEEEEWEGNDKRTKDMNRTDFFHVLITCFQLQSRPMPHNT